MELSMAIRRSVLGSSLLLAFAVGCQPAPKPAGPPLPPPATEDQASSVQAEFQDRDPNARAGLVTQLRSQEGLAAVTLVASPEKATNKIKVGDIFTFIDSRQNPIANGKVVSIDADVAVISYLPSPDGRVPKEGDIAVHLSSK
jgi:hypothetical protein